MSELNAPLVSVVMPTFNRSGAIRASIDSVLNQSVGNWELIVVSDASTDDTDEIVSAYADPRIRLIRLEERSGHPGRPRNEGIAAARSNLIAYLDHDDVYQPWHLAGALQIMEANAADIAAFGARYESQGGDFLGETTFLDMVWHPEIQSIGPLFQPTRIVHRKSVVDHVGGWTESTTGLEDWELWLRLADAGYVFLTVHDRSTTIVMGDAQRSGALPVKWSIPLARLSSVEDVTAAHELLCSAATMASMEEVTVLEATNWYRQLWDSDQLVLPILPAGEEQPGWSAISGFIRAQQRAGALPPLRAKPLDDGSYDVGIDLLVADRAHAERTVEVFSRRFPQKIALTRSIFHSVQIGA